VRELEAFSYSISHDLRGPLRTVHGFASMLEDQVGDDLPSEALHSLKRIKAGADSIGSMIDELLTLSRLGRQPLAHTTVDLSALAHEIVAELRSADPERDVIVSLQPGLRVTGDEQLLRIALTNLLDNAFKFTRQTTDADVEISGTREGENLSIHVSDNGAGFDPEYANRLFSPFQRLHSESEFPGTGIGLTTVKRVIHRHAGSITASGAPGRGANFSFVLPSATEPDAATADEAAPRARRDPADLGQPDHRRADDPRAAQRHRQRQLPHRRWTTGARASARRHARGPFTVVLRPLNRL
jgi:light-regulated signal transduction histidine kinase (bacteriophytochrome)